MRRFIFVLIVILLINFIPIRASACNGKEPVPVKMHATAYCIHGTTASGKKTRHGLAAARRDLIGKTALVYQRLPGDVIGDLIGIYEVEDTGGTDGLKNGTVIDIWCADEDECQLFMNRVYEDECHGKVFVFFVDAVG